MVQIGLCFIRLVWGFFTICLGVIGVCFRVGLGFLEVCFRVVRVGLKLVYGLFWVGLLRLYLLGSRVDLQSSILDWFMVYFGLV